jgi:hypothetical protein
MIEQESYYHLPCGHLVKEDPDDEKRVVRTVGCPCSVWELTFKNRSEVDARRISYK